MSTMRFLIFSIFFVFYIQSTYAEKRDGKLLSLFNVVTFPNDACNGGTKNGTCYTKDECSNKGGTEDGSCASGYGVCCIFALKCGTTISENNTYFESGGSEVGACNFKVCPCNDNICQLRLDFDTFVITGPSTDTNTGKFGAGPGALKLESSTSTRCLTDVFTVSNPGGPSVPPVCGTLNGDHMYVDANMACNDLNMLLGEQAATGTTLATRSWSVRISQIECGSETLAPPGCTQYHYGDSNGVIQSYNFDGGRHLADQYQSICIRRESGNCKICYTTAAITDLSISLGKASSFSTKAASCCTYGADGMKTVKDCIVIPSLQTTKGKLLNFDAFCGSGGLGSKAEKLDATKQKTLCTTKQPFKVTFDSDGYESKAESAAGISQKGFKLYYIQSSNSC